MDIRPIRTETDYEAALTEIERLWNAEPGTDAGDRLDVLVALTAAYEDRRYPIAKSTPLEALKFLMAENGRTQADLAALLGSRSRASEILNGKRDLTLEQIRLLHNRWRVPASVLIGDLESA